MLRLRTTCPRDCPDRCGVVAWVADGKLVKVEGDPDHPFTQGFLCGKCYSYPEQVHSPQRLTTPLIRDGPKGSGKFRKATWDEALDLVVSRMRDAAARHGAASILPYGYAGHEGFLSAKYPFRFFRAIGASALAKTICAAEGDAAMKDLYGTYPGFDERNIGLVDLYVFWGVNPVHSSVHVFHHVKTSGVPFWVIDPIRTPTAREAGRHLQPRPGSDPALAMAMAGVILRAGREDAGFRAIPGAAEFEAAARGMGLTEAERRTGIPAAEIGRVALAYAEARHPILHLGIGLQHGAEGYDAFVAAAGLVAVAGKTGLDGGLQYIGKPEARSGYHLPSLEPAGEVPPVPRTVNMIEIGRALGEADPPVEVLYVWNSNPAATAPDQRAIHQGLRREGLFTVVHDLFLTDTARFADVVLPAASAFESEDFAHAWYGNYAGHVRPVVAPIGESKSNFEVTQELGRRWGLPGFEEDTRTFLRRAIRLPGGRTLDDLGEDPMVTFAQAPTAPRAPLRLITPSLAPEPAAGEGEIVLVGTKDKRLMSTQFAEIGAIARTFAAGAILTMRAEDARRLGVEQAAQVEASTAHGSCRFRLRIAEETPPGVAWTTSIPPPALLGAPNANALIPGTATRRGGGAAFNGQRVRVRAA